MNCGIIYGYRKITEDKIVYVGQTTNIDIRHKQHTVYDPYNPTTREYNYPLSRGIRKYGVEEYELIILENNIPKDDLNTKEKEYIEKYDTLHNGYNQCAGGLTYGFSKYPLSIIEEVRTMLIAQKTFEEIYQKTKVSFPHISNINTGNRAKKDGLVYPLKQIHCGGKISDNKVTEIINLLITSSLSQQTISELYDVSQSVINRINLGKRKYIPNKEKYTFPLRK